MPPKKQKKAESDVCFSSDSTLRIWKKFSIDFEKNNIYLLDQKQSTDGITPGSHSIQPTHIQPDFQSYDSSRKRPVPGITDQDRQPDNIKKYKRNGTAFDTYFKTTICILSKFYSQVISRCRSSYDDYAQRIAQKIINELKLQKSSSNNNERYR